MICMKKTKIFWSPKSNIAGRTGIYAAGTLAAYENQGLVSQKFW